MVYKFIDKKSTGSGIIANESNYQLVKELRKPVIRKLKKRKVYSSFRDNMWGVYLADMQSLSKYNKKIKYLLCAIYLILFNIIFNIIYLVNTHGLFLSKIKGN